MQNSGTKTVELATYLNQLPTNRTDEPAVQGDSKRPTGYQLQYAYPTNEHDLQFKQSALDQYAYSRQPEFMRKPSATESEVLREQYKGHLAMIAEKKEQSLNRSKSHSRGHSADVSPHHRRDTRNAEPGLSSKDLGYKVVNESSYIDPSNNASMSSIYKRI
jgi:hypothetical protein